MNIHTPEQLRQHEAHQEHQRRLWPAVKPGVKLLAAPVDAPDAVRSIDVTLVRAKIDPQVLRIRMLEQQVIDKDLQISDLQASSLRMAEIIAGYIAKEAAAVEIDAIDDEEQEARPIKRPIRVIVEEVLLDYPGITWEAVKGVHRSRSLTTPRHHCMAAVYEQRPDLSFPAIARHFDRDHTTVLHAVRKLSTVRGKA